MINFKLTIPGQPIVKKNTAILSFFYWKKTGGLKVKVPRDKPILIYSKPYASWARSAVEKTAIFKSNESLKPNGLPLPIAEPLVITFLFFVKTHHKVDLTALIEGPQDVLSGNAGSNCFPKSFNHDSYKLIADDNKDIVKNLGGSTVMFDPLRPRTEIYVTSFDLAKWGQTMVLLHPGLPIIRPDDSVPQIKFDFSELFGDK